MPDSDMRIRLLEERIARLEGRESAVQAILGAVARTVAQTDVRSVEDVVRRIENWERFFEPAFTASLSSDHNEFDAIKQEARLSTLRYFFEQARGALPEEQPSTGNS
ncbi:hypothetical protein [Methylorubrum extorquens]|uniref:Uncharacterized protein n=1 Tax=Methylorubrum extorquens (strain ATCC 14718 / DSM 1338 / JCM 2805 / NCIMB 9133 / AM1) TaxID=272630 RepID=C5B6V7_METEA|nr:hypothetical protein [Methylorubrum extorquens]ACS44189.1 Hypothetical protein MexAM1_p3METAp0013 [Methylorubrum extorquens AM1]MCP1591992.1 chorismate synthase [Methylorubrum extorquens]